MGSYPLIRITDLPPSDVLQNLPYRVSELNHAHIFTGSGTYLVLKIMLLMLGLPYVAIW